MIYKSIAIAATLLYASSVYSQTTLERVLLPIYSEGEIPGSYSSRWVEKVWITNASDERIEFVISCPFDGCGRVPLQPGETSTGPLGGRSDVALPKYVYVTRPAKGEAKVSLRIQDLSRQLLTWGTEIPTLRERDLRSGSINLVDIPRSDPFRLALRVYTIKDGVEPLLRLRIYPLLGQQTALVDEVVQIRQTFDSPGYLQILDLRGAYPVIASQDPLATLRIEISSIDPTTRFWAFVSVTNNVTQHVTTITPR